MYAYIKFITSGKFTTVRLDQIKKYREQCPNKIFKVKIEEEYHKCIVIATNDSKDELAKSIKDGPRIRYPPTSLLSEPSEDEKSIARKQTTLADNTLDILKTKLSSMNQARFNEEKKTKTDAKTEEHPDSSKDTKSKNYLKRKNSNDPKPLNVSGDKENDKKSKRIKKEPGLAKKNKILIKSDCLIEKPITHFISNVNKLNDKQYNSHEKIINGKMTDDLLPLMPVPQINSDVSSQASCSKLSSVQNKDPVDVTIPTELVFIPKTNKNSSVHLIKGLSHDSKNERKKYYLRRNQRSGDQGLCRQNNTSPRRKTREKTRNPGVLASRDFSQKPKETPDCAKGIQLCEELRSLLRQKLNQLRVTQTVNPKLRPSSQSMILFPQDSKSDTKNSNQHRGFKCSDNARSSNVFPSTESSNTSNQKRFKPSGPEDSEKFPVSDRHKFPKKFEDAALNSITSYSPSLDKSPHSQPISSSKVFRSPITSDNQTKTSQGCENSLNKDHNGSLDRTSTRGDNPKYVWNISSAKKKELRPDSDIYINEVDLNYIKMKFRKDPPEMARRLLKSIIGEDRLSTMSRTGGNGWQPLPLDVSQTVYEYVRANSKPTLNLDKFERAVTQMFTSIRRSNNVPSKSVLNSEHSKKSSSSTSQKLSQIQTPKSPQHRSQILTPKSSQSQLKTLTPKSSNHRSPILTPKSPERQRQTLTSKSPHHRSQILTPKPPERERQARTPKSPHHRSQILTPKSPERQRQTLTPKSSHHRLQIRTPKPPERERQTRTPKSPHHRSQIRTLKSPERQRQTLTPKSSHRRSYMVTRKPPHGSKPSLPSSSQSPYNSSGRSHHRSKHHSPNDRQLYHRSRKSSHHRWSRDRSRSRSEYSRRSESHRKR